MFQAKACFRQICFIKTVSLMVFHCQNFLVDVSRIIFGYVPFLADEGPSVVVPTSSGRPIVPIFPTEEAPSASKEENTTDDNNPDGNCK